eukprot:6800963-Karenia_brevis.AAC.1
MDVNILLPRANMNQMAIDEVALYGFRSSHPNVFFTSPWEFTQWFKPHQFEPPSQSYNWSVLTSSGLQKLRMAKGVSVSLEIGIDYIINEKIFAKCSFL